MHLDLRARWALAKKNPAAGGAFTAIEMNQSFLSRQLKSLSSCSSTQLST